ncbi:MAG TPA: glycosyltransferase family 4 protein [Desulfobacteraceae bacterium]|nr:glycosyltransferase family 4 protein [Desulfobacteraceae bacterium]
MVLYIIITASFSYFLTGVIRRYALAKNMMDIPGERSSHSLPTPLGGGAAIVLVVLAGLIVMKTAGVMPVSFFAALAGAGTLVASIGWIDDRRDLKAGSRLAGHFIASGWALYWLGGLPPLTMLGHVVDLGWAGHILASFYLVWLLNLYNFMDGIDGIAGIEAVTVCVGGVILSIISGTNGTLLSVPVLLAPASIGFLFWNFPKARIFMGDAGSGFLGITLGILSIKAGWAAPELFWGWLILPGAFVVDATVTLLRRASTGKNVYEAHRSHAYQHAALRLGAHPPVSLAYGAATLFWLLPMAALVAGGFLGGPSGLIFAYAPLTAAVIWLNAGKD